MLFIVVVWYKFDYVAMGKKVFERNKEAITLYGFLTLVWVFRVTIAIVNPWPIEPIAWAAYAQLIGAVIIMLLLLIPYIKVRFSKKKES
jgi:hypothetical protein